MSDIILIEALIYLLAAVTAVPIARRFGLGSVLGYLIAGIIIAPLLHHIGSDTDDLQHFAEFGVVMMLFLVGLELEPDRLWGMRHRLLGLGGLQILISTVLLMGIAMIFGFAWQTALAIGLILAPSSTAIALQTLTEKGLLKSTGGQGGFSILLFQDVAVIPMLTLIPLLAIPDLIGHSSEGAHESGSILSNYPVWMQVILTFGAIAAIYLVGKYLTRPVFRFIARAKIREIFTAAALTIVISISVLMGLVGLSAALGTFLAGVVLASSEYRHELQADIEPFKGLLLGLFFITVGAGIDFGLLAKTPLLIVGLVIGILLIKGAVIWAVASLFNIKGQDRWLMALGLAQAGEFAFVLLSVAGPAHVLPNETLKTLSLVVALTMVLTPLLFLAYEKLIENKKVEENKREADEIDDEGDVIIAGQGRFGQVVNRVLLAKGIKSVVLDHESTQIERLRPFGIKAFFGDPTRIDLLHAAGLMKAKTLVVAIDNPQQAVKLVEIARKERPDLHIVARARDRTNVYQLYQAGADDIVREMFDSSIRAARYTLQSLGMERTKAIRTGQHFVKQDRKALRMLAEVWDPEIHISANPAYVEMARQINTDIGRAMEGLDVEMDDEDASKKLRTSDKKSKP